MGCSAWRKRLIGNSGRSSKRIFPPRQATPSSKRSWATNGGTWPKRRAGQDRTLCLMRAGFWYQKAMAKMPASLLRIRTEKRIADIRAEHSAR